MTWLTPKLDRKIDICKPTQTPLADGSFERDYEIALTVWASIAPIKPTAYVRNVQIEGTITHRFIVRKIAIESIDNLSEDLYTNPIKTNYFIFMRQSTLSKGRRFAIKNVLNNGERNEYCEIYCEEIGVEGV